MRAAPPWPHSRVALAIGGLVFAWAGGRVRAVGRQAEAALRREADFAHVHCEAGPVNVSLAVLCTGLELRAGACYVVACAQEVGARCLLRGPPDGSAGAAALFSEGQPCTAISGDVELNITGHIQMVGLRWKVSKLTFDGASVSLNDSFAGDAAPLGGTLHEPGGTLYATNGMQVIGGSVLRISNSSAFAGGAIYTKTDLRIDNASSILITAVEGYTGGGVYAAGTVTVEGGSLLSISNAYAVNYGGGLDANDLQVRGQSAVSVENASAGACGAINLKSQLRLIEGSVVNITGATALIDRPEGAGGFCVTLRGELLMAGGSALNLVNVSSKGKGGGFLVTRVRLTEKSRVNITGARALDMGGGFYAKGDVLVESGAVLSIVNASAGTNGGGFYADGCVDVLAEASLRLFGVSAGLGGGGFFARLSVVAAGEAVISIEAASAGLSGGGFYTSGDVMFERSVLEIIGATAVVDGAGFYSEGGNATITNRSRLEIFGVDAGRNGGGFLAGEVRLFSGGMLHVRAAHAMRGGGLYSREDLFADSGVDMRFDSVGAAYDGGGMYIGGSLSATNARITIEGANAYGDGSGVMVARELRLTLASKLEISLAHSVVGAAISASAVTLLDGSQLRGNRLESSTRAAALRAGCLRVTGHSLVTLLDIQGHMGAELDGRLALGVCANRGTLVVDGGGALLAEGVQAPHGALWIAGHKGEMVHLVGLRFGLVDGPFANVTAGSTVVVGVSAELGGNGGRLPLLGVSGELSVVSLNVTCPTWSAGCEAVYGQRSNGSMLYVAQGGPHARCQRSAMVFDNATNVCECAPGWLRARSQTIDLIRKTSGACAYCVPCDRNQYYVEDSGECAQCPIYSPWSPGTVGSEVPSCGVWPLSSVVFWTLFLSAGALAISASSVWVLLRAKLYIIDMRLTDLEARGDGRNFHGPSRPGFDNVSRVTMPLSQGLVLTVQGLTMLLPRVLKKMLCHAVQYRVEGSGADSIDYDSKTHNLFTIKQRGPCRVELCGELASLDRASSKGALRPVRWLHVYGACLAVLIVVFALPAMLIAAVKEYIGFLDVLFTFTIMVLCWLGIVCLLLLLGLSHLLQGFSATPLKLAHKEYQQTIRHAPSTGVSSSSAGEAVDLSHPHYCGIAAGVLADLLEHYRPFILDRNMHYVVRNIVEPLTESAQVSFAALWGGRRVMHFVSHSWLTPFTEFVDTIEHHARAVAGQDWRAQTYWICSFSNNQWRIEAELGNSIMESAFARVISGGVVRDLVMVLDAQVQPLQRVWCLFELLLATKERLNVVFATPMGIVGDPNCVSVDIVFAIADVIQTLRVNACNASREEDKQNILSFIVGHLGSLENMDGHIKQIMARAIQTVALHVHTKSEHTIQQLMCAASTPILAADSEPTVHAPRLWAIGEPEGILPGTHQLALADVRQVLPASTTVVLIPRLWEVGEGTAPPSPRSPPPRRPPDVAVSYSPDLESGAVEQEPKEAAIFYI